MSACFSSRYAPTGSGRVTEQYNNGVLYYVVDDDRYKAGFGGGLVKAVSSNPAAASAARTARNRNIASFLLLLPSLACTSSVSGFDGFGGDFGRGVFELNYRSIT